MWMAMREILVSIQVELMKNLVVVSAFVGGITCKTRVLTAW